MSARHVACALVLSLLGVGCGKTDSSLPGTPPAMTGGSGAATGGVPVGGAAALACDGPHPGPAPLGRLGNFELNRALRDLFSDVPGLEAPAKLIEDRYSDDPTTEANTQAVSMLHDVVHDLALRLTDSAAQIQGVTGCNQLAQGEAACEAQFLDKFLKRAYRRALTDEDRAEMREVFAAGQELGGDFASGVRAVVEVALQNPDFVYLIEQGSGQPAGDAVELTSYETAARLAFFLTGSAPDNDLLAAADQGALGPAELEAQARRLLGAAPNREVLRHFYSRLLGLEFLEPNEALGYTAELIAAAQEESARFVEDVTFDDGGTYRALLTAPTTWVNGPLARFYGYPNVDGSAFQKIQLDPAKRLGILTQSAFLRATSPPNRTSPVHRGLRVLEQMLCYKMPPPPPGIALPSVDPPPDSTTRQRLELATNEPTCQGCHREINPVGYMFEHYDQVGLWRDTENGFPIDSSGELFRTDMQGKFKDAIELVERMAESRDAKACFVGHWLEAAYRRGEAAEDACSRQEQEQVFANTDGKVVELMIALTKTDNFRYRLKSELAP
jgi:Protein of unknown function (DUF1588)/Protein of unknown function (DUF1592)/Protein of unknown function (DUF1595)/Protein of unknown function (DUF1585)